MAETFPQQRSLPVSRVWRGSELQVPVLNGNLLQQKNVGPLLFLWTCFTELQAMKLFKISALLCCDINCDVMKWRWVLCKSVVAPYLFSVYEHPFGVIIPSMPLEGERAS